MKNSGVSPPSHSESKVATGHSPSPERPPASDEKSWKQCIHAMPAHPERNRARSRATSEPYASAVAGLLFPQAPIPIHPDSGEAGAEEESQETSCDAAQHIAGMSTICGAADDLDPGLNPLVDGLAGSYAQHQLFEVIMPNRQVIGVLVQANAQCVNITLTPHDRQYAKAVKKQDRALENELKKRLGKEIDLSVVL